jgi:hypothetical protein
MEAARPSETFLTVSMTECHGWGWHSGKSLRLIREVLDSNLALDNGLLIAFSWFSSVLPDKYQCHTPIKP